MATTSRPITELVLGIRDTSGAVVPSAKVRFYQPGTLVQQTVFSDAACTSGLSQPVTCNAYGQATVYTREAVRCIAKNAAETTTVYDNVCNLNRADAVYMTVAGLNGGNETTVEEAFEDAVASFGAGFQYADSSSASATPRNWVDRIKESHVSVKDYGAVGDGTTDDTAAITATLTASANRPIYFPPGTYKITSAINLTPAGNARFRIFGAASGTTGASIIKNFGTTTNAFTINDPFDGEYVISDLEIATNTTTTGYAIRGQDGARLTCDRLTISGHKYGIDVSGMDQASIRSCKVTLSDTAGVGVKVTAATAATVLDCRVIGPGTGGTSRGFEIGSAQAVGCFAYNLAVGFYVGSGGEQANTLGCHASLTTTGYSIQTANCGILGSKGTLNTTDLASTGQNNLVLSGSSFSTVSLSGNTYAPVAMGNLVTTNSAAAAPTWTMDFANGQTIQRFIGSYAAAAQALTIAAPTNTSALLPGTIVWTIFCKQNANNLNLTWPATFLDEDGSALSGPASVTSGQAYTLAWFWNGANFVRLMFGLNAAI